MTRPETQRILRARDLVMATGNRAEVSRILGVPTATLQYWSRKYGWAQPRANVTRSLNPPKPRRWRCCGLLQAIDPDTPPVCARCGETPTWARPEPDLRHFRVGR